MLVPLDTTILSNFALVGLTSILIDLWGDQVATTEEVLKEYAAGIEIEKSPCVDWTHLKWVELMGTIGILKTCVQSKLLSQVDPQLKLEEMIAAGFYSTVLKLDFD